jgi:hypothetical protein
LLETVHGQAKETAVRSNSVGSCPQIVAQAREAAFALRAKAKWPT